MYVRISLIKYRIWKLSWSWYINSGGKCFHGKPNKKSNNTLIMYFNLLCRTKKDSEQENRKNNYTSTTYRYFFKENWNPNGNKYLHIGYRYLRQQYAKMHLYSLQDNNFNALLFVAFTKTSGLRTEIMKPARILSTVRWVRDYEKNEKNAFLILGTL